MSLQHRAYNLKWRLQALQSAVDDVKVEIDRLAAEVAAIGQQEGSKTPSGAADGND